MATRMRWDYCRDELEQDRINAARERRAPNAAALRARIDDAVRYAWDPALVDVRAEANAQTSWAIASGCDMTPETVVDLLAKCGVRS